MIGKLLLKRRICLYVGLIETIGFLTVWPKPGAA